MWIKAFGVSLILVLAFFIWWITLPADLEMAFSKKKLFRGSLVKKDHPMDINTSMQKSLIVFVQFFVIATTKLNLRFRN